MDSEEKQHRLARRALWVAVLLGVGVLVYFVVQDEPVAGIIVALLLVGSGYTEYQRRQRDREMTEPDEDPFERRERLR